MRIAVLYEHPEWFIPLFNALEHRGIETLRIHAASLRWDPSRPPPFALLINRMSPSAYRRGHAHALHASAAFLAYVEAHGVPIINGSAAYRLELSKAGQMDLLQRLRLPHPRARVINNAHDAPQAAEGFRFPIVVKPNIGGSGALIQKHDTADSLARAADAGQLELGVDSTALVQEFLPARGGSITRVELLDGELLYAIRVTPPAGFGFNLCPADICRDQKAPGAERAAATAKPAMRIEAVGVEPAVLDGARRIAAAGRLDVCGIEFLVDDRDGQPYFYDINALSNFVTDAQQVVGFDPFERFVDTVTRRLATAEAIAV